MVAIKNIGDVKIMRAIGPAEINKLISFRGIVVRTSDIVPEMKRAFFKCVKC
jgi:DNA replication licensing factor MCM4